MDKRYQCSVRMLPSLKKKLDAHADHEHRSLTNMLEVMIMSYDKSHPLKPQDQDKTLDS